MRVYEEPPVGASRWLLLGGLFMLLVPFLRGNPLTGGEGEPWPWEIFQQGDAVQAQTGFVLWVLVGLVALLFSFSQRAGLRRRVLIGLGAALLVVVASRQGGFDLTQRSGRDLFLLMLLGGGLAGSWRAQGPSWGRWVAGVAGLALLVQAHVFPDPDYTGICLAQGLFEDVRTWFDQGAGAVRHASNNHLAVHVVPNACLLLASLLAVLVALGASSVWVVRIALLLVLVGVFMPGITQLVDGWQASDDFGWPETTAGLVHLFVAWGGALWLVGAGVVRDALPRGGN